MKPDDIYGQPFVYDGLRGYFRTELKRKTYGNRHHRSGDVHGNEQRLGNPAKKGMRYLRGSIPSMDDWIDNQEACMMMDISPGKLLALRRKRAIPYSHIDRKVYYKRQDIIRFMEDTIHLVNI